MKYLTSQGEYNYQELLHSNQNNNSTLYISTYNIVLNDKLKALLNKFNSIYIVVNSSPLRQVKYNKLREITEIINNQNINFYVSRINHSKIIASQDIAYIGSANFSSSSINNIESGVIIYDKDVIQKIKIDFETKIIPNSSSLRSIISNYENYSLKDSHDCFIVELKKTENALTELKSAREQFQPIDPITQILPKLNSLSETLVNLEQKAKTTTALSDLNISDSLNFEKSLILTGHPLKSRFRWMSC